LFSLSATERGEGAWTSAAVEDRKKSRLFDRMNRIHRMGAQVNQKLFYPVILSILSILSKKMQIAACASSA